MIHCFDKEVEIGELIDAAEDLAAAHVFECWDEQETDLLTQLPIRRLYPNACPICQLVVKETW